MVHPSNKLDDSWGTAPRPRFYGVVCVLTLALYKGKGIGMLAISYVQIIKISLKVIRVKFKPHTRTPKLKDEI